MKATLTSKRQITIPIRIRQRLGLQAGDELEFDEEAPCLVARRAIDEEQWAATRKTLKDHPWESMSTAEMLDDMRGPVWEPEAEKGDSK